MANHKKQLLKVEVKDDRLTISLGINTLSNAFYDSPENSPYDDDTGNFERILKVTDTELFAEEVVRLLMDGEEDGATAVTRMFDDIFMRVLDDGVDGVEEV